MQKLVFPSGIFLNKENCNYQTESENEVFKIMGKVDILGDETVAIN